MWPEPTWLNRIGFGLVIDGSTRRAAPWDVRIVMLPYWTILLAFAFFAARAAIRAKAPVPGHCCVCGYDLRATPDRCPECGTVPERPIGTA